MTREEAIKMLKSKMDGHTDTSYEWAETVRMAIEALKDQRPHGEWISNNSYNRRWKTFLDCSVCHYGKNGDVICQVTKIPRFCPNCGAIMDGRR